MIFIVNTKQLTLNIVHRVENHESSKQAYNFTSRKTNLRSPIHFC